MVMTLFYYRIILFGFGHAFSYSVDICRMASATINVCSGLEMVSIESFKPLSAVIWPNW